MHKLLLELGCKPSLKGFKYLQSAINYVKDNPNTYMGDVYYTVAKEYNVNWRNVERCIKQCIVVASSTSSTSKWNEVFGQTVNPDNCSVTNKEFVFALADYLKITSGPEKYWDAIITENSGMSTRTMRVSGDTYTDAFMNAMMQLDKDILPSDPTRGIIGLKPVKI